MGKPDFNWQGNNRSILAFCLPVIVLISMAYATSYGGVPPGSNPPSQAPLAQAPPNSSPTPQAAPANPPSPDFGTAIKKTQEALINKEFSYSPTDMPDPFIPFVAPPSTAKKLSEPETGEEAKVGFEPENQKPLTPLQRMSQEVIEKGLKAITWGEMGRRALIEDPTGKGYIVSIGTPIGDKNGVITQIFNDHLVIQQEVLDKESNRMVSQKVVVRLWKGKK